jgi:hypothetical protein
MSVMTMYTGVPVGPAFVANGFVVDEVDEQTGVQYHLTLYPDMFNASLREERKEMWFYYIPDSPRLARNDQGNWMFHFSKFFGIADESTFITATTPTETAGGFMAFTSTLQVPDRVLERCIAKLKGASSDNLFAWAEGMPSPRIGHVPIMAAETVISNLGGAVAGEGAPPTLAQMWSWKMLGEGASAANPTARNAYTAALGPFAAAAMEAAFAGQSSPVFVHTKLKHKFWTTPIRIRLRAQWKRVFDHLSAAFQGRIFSIKTDLQGQFNRLVSSGVIQRELFIDGEQVGPERVKEIEARAQLVFDKFVSEAEKAIFAPAPTIEAAKAEPNDGLLGLFPGKSFALKAERDVTTFELSYDETLNQTFLWENIVSAHLKGFFDELGANPENRAKYFSEVDVGSAFRKLRVLAECNANWGEDGQPGDPIRSIGVEIGYRDVNGTLQTQGSARFATPANPQPSSNVAPAVWTKDTRDRIYLFDFAKRTGEHADEITVHETISFREAPNVEVDLIDRVRTQTTTKVEVHADSLGGLVVGPIRFDFDISVAMRSGTRPAETLRFDLTNAEAERFWKTWAVAQPGGMPWQHRIKVIIKGRSFGQPPLEWSSDWVDHVGNGEVTLHVPSVPDELAARVQEYLAP